LLRYNYSVSIELETLGPAFYGKSNNSQSLECFDPAMCNFEMALYYNIYSSLTPHSDKMITSPSSLSVASVNTSVTSTRSPITPSKNKADLVEAALFFRLEGRNYQVDLAHIRKIDVELEDETSSTSSNKPPCLVIQCCLCSFRIFSLSGVVADQYSILNSAKTRLAGAVSSASRRALPADNTSLASPSGSSTAPSSSNEPGQREVLRETHPQAKVEGEEDEEEEDEEEYIFDEVFTRKSKEERDRVHKIIQRRQRSYQKSQQGLKALQKLLALPLGHHKLPQNARENGVGTLLTAVADDLASSYCTQALFDQAAQAYDSELKQCHYKTVIGLKALLPTTARQRKKFRRSLPVDSRLHAAYFMPYAKQLIQDHKDAVTARHALMMLPGRG
jgi:hypothetical protein